MFDIKISPSVNSNIFHAVCFHVSFDHKWQTKNCHQLENNDKDELSDELSDEPFDELSDDLSDELLNKKIRGNTNTKVAYNGQAQIKTRIRRLACMCPNCKNGVRGQTNMSTNEVPTEHRL